MITLVLLPGLDGTGQLFADFAAAFGDEVKVVVVSYPADTALGYAELTSVARSFLPLDQPYFLLAESFSGPIGISIAASAPPGLLGLVLCCSFARNPVPMSGFLRPLLGAFPVAKVPVRLLGVFLLGRFSSPTLLRALGNSLATVCAAALRARARAVLAVDVSAELARIRVPILYLRAAEDRVVPRASSEQVRSCAPQTRLVEFTAPHFLLQVLPLAVAAEVTDFMRGLR